ncbi:hypothetical protein GE21DRAFT_1340434 [Neurospora crassa]|nr:hypothetical protein GE21DRAFT_1340434 [Neurospora crassa]
MVAYAIPRGRTTYTCTPDGRGEKSSGAGSGTACEWLTQPHLDIISSIISEKMCCIRVAVKRRIYYQLREMDDCEIWLVPHTVEEATKSQGLHDRATIPHYYTTTYMSLAVTVTLWQARQQQ